MPNRFQANVYKLYYALIAARDGDASAQDAASGPGAEPAHISIVTDGVVEKSRFWRHDPPGRTSAHWQ